MPELDLTISLGKEEKEEIKKAYREDGVLIGFTNLNRVVTRLMQEGFDWGLELGKTETLEDIEEG